MASLDFPVGFCGEGAHADQVTLLHLTDPDSNRDQEEQEADAGDFGLPRYGAEEVGHFRFPFCLSDLARALSQIR